MRFALLLLLLSAGPAHAALPDCLSEAEFRALASEIAPKVNLFAEAWKQDSAAEFYGGTTRDYLYWIKGKFQACHDPDEGARIANELRLQKSIDVREFIVGDSDVDIVSREGVQVDPAPFGIKKIDKISPEIFDPETEKGMNEVVQGHIPAEKIRLGANGVHAPEGFGDGLGEIYSGRLTVHFASAADFAKGSYAKLGINHPVLLALRYQRLLGIDYFKTHGAGLPDDRKLFAIDPASEKAVREVMASAAKKDALKPYFAKDQFKKWFNGAVQKSFRSYTNPTAAKKILEHFGLPELARLYPAIEPINQYVFQRYRDEGEVAKKLRAYKVKPEALYVPAPSLFTDGYLYHGTKDELAFRGILLQGFLPSETGSGGAGLYGVASTNRKFAEEWGGDVKRLVRIPVRPDAKIIDMKSGEGKRLWGEFTANGGMDFEEFADAFGADILRYPYNSDAYVVKNASVLGRPEGVNRKILSVTDARALAAKVHDSASFFDVVDSLKLNGFTMGEMEQVLEEVPLPAHGLWPAVDDQKSVNKILAAIEDHRSTTSLALRKYLGEPPAGWLDAFLAPVHDEKSFENFTARLPSLWNLRDESAFERALDRVLAAPRSRGSFDLLKDPKPSLQSILGAIPPANRSDPLTDAFRRRLRGKAVDQLKTLDADGVKWFLSLLAHENNEKFDRFLSDDASLNAIIDAWRKNGVFAEMEAPITTWKQLEERVGKRTSTGKALLEKMLQVEKAPMLAFLASRTEVSDLGEAIRFVFRTDHKWFFTEEELKPTVAAWAHDGPLAKAIAAIHTVDDFTKFRTRLAGRGDSLSNGFREAVYPLLGQRAEALWKGRSLVTEAIRREENPGPAVYAQAFASGANDPENRLFITAANSANFLGEDRASSAQRFQQFCESPAGLHDEELVRELLKHPDGVYTEALLGALGHKGSAIAQIAETEAGMKELLDRSLVMNFDSSWNKLFGKNLRAALTRFSTLHPAAYDRLAPDFYDRLLSRFPERFGVNSYELWTGLLDVPPGDPVLHHPHLATWIQRLVDAPEHLDLMYAFGADHATVLHLLALPEVQRLPESTKWIEQLLLNRELKRPAVDAGLKKLLAKEPWSRHPRAPVWEKALSVRHSLENDFLLTRLLTRRSRLLGRDTFLGLGQDRAIRAWHAGITGKAAAPARCGKFFGLFGGRKP